MTFEEEISKLNIHKTLGHFRTSDPLRWEEINHPISTPKTNVVSQALQPDRPTYRQSF